MTLPWTSYTLADYAQAKPLVQALKSARYQAVRRRYERRNAVLGDEPAIRSRLSGKKVLITIAFEDAMMIARQAELVARFVPHDVHIVADNSLSEDGARAVLNAAESAGLVYLRLPPNPWTRIEPSRSHGLAMNWIWKRILGPSSPQAFGFLDHDLFPLAPDDPFSLLDVCPFYGDQRHAGGRWFLWAGFCFFRMRDVENLPLDFGQDWFIGLDTGGGNWRSLYRLVEFRSLPHRPISVIPAIPGILPDRAYFEMRGNWLHAVGFGGDIGLKVAKRDALVKRLDSALNRSHAVGSYTG